MDPTLRGARARYSADEPVGGEPAREQYAAARRWLACARDAVRWSRGATGTREALWLAKACDALVRADQHRTSARRWRATRAVTKDAGSPVGGLPEAEDPETRTLEAVFRQTALSRSSVVAYYAAARHALGLVRVYQDEPGTTGRREREALVQVSRYRAAIRDLRAAILSPIDSGRPGLSKTGPPSSQEGRRDRAAG